METRVFYMKNKNTMSTDADAAAVADAMESGRNAFTTSAVTNPIVFTKSPPGNFWKGQSDVQIRNGYSSRGSLVADSLSTILPTYQEYKFTKKISLAKFISQTLNYVVAQLFITAVITVITYEYKDLVNNYIQIHSGIIWIPIILSFTTLIMLYCSSNLLLKKTMFWLFTLSCGSLVAVSTIQYAPEVIMSALITLFLIIVIVNIYAYHTAINEKDLSFMGPSLIGCLFIIIIMNIINIFIKITLLEIVISALSVILFTVLLLYDLNRLYTGVEAEDDILMQPILAAINIYLDIINIFLNLLRIFNK